jgi:hypothetical protein
MTCYYNSFGKIISMPSGVELAVGYTTIDIRVLLQGGRRSSDLPGPFYDPGPSPPHDSFGMEYPQSINQG